MPRNVLVISWLALALSVLVPSMACADRLVEVIAPTDFGCTDPEDLDRVATELFSVAILAVRGQPAPAVDLDGCTFFQEAELLYLQFLPTQPFVRVRRPHEPHLLYWTVPRALRAFSPPHQPRQCLPTVPSSPSPN